MTETIAIPEAPKPGYRTTEFWLSLAAKLLGAAFASGLIGDGTALARIAGLAAMVLAGLGYTVSRTLVKTAGALLLVLALCSTQPACTHDQRTAGLGAVVDCGKADKGALLGLAVELGAAAVRDVQTSETVDWKALGLKAAAEGVLVGGCAFARFVRELAKPAPAVEGAVAREAPNPALVELERLRAGWGGVRWSVEL